VNAALAWSDAVAAAQLFAVDPVGTGGVLVRSRAGPVRDRWLAILRGALPPSRPFRHLPLHIADGRLLGGLDLNATLLAGCPVAERGLLAEADGGVLVLAMAERLSSATTVHITAAMDAHETIVERDGLSLRMPARFGVIALDEGLEDESSPAALRDRLAFHVDLDDISIRDADEIDTDGKEIVAARARLPLLKVSSEQIEAISAAAGALGIASLRAPLLMIRAACANGALSGHAEVESDDIGEVSGIGTEPIESVALDMVGDPTVPVSQIDRRVVVHPTMIPPRRSLLGAGRRQSATRSVVPTILHSGRSGLAEGFGRRDRTVALRSDRPQGRQSRDERHEE